MSSYVYTTDTNTHRDSEFTAQGPLMPARAFFFVTVDEVGPQGFLVRHTYSAVEHPKLRELNIGLLKELREVNPERMGLWARNTDSLADITAHVLQTDRVTSYVSTSGNFPEGAKRFEGKTVFVDIAAAKRAGARLVTPEEIGRGIDEYVKDKNSKTRREANYLKSKALGIDNEFLIRPNPVVPAEAIFSQRGLAQALGFVKWARVVQVFGIFFTGYDIAVSTQESVRIKSARPLEKSVLRNLAGWEGSLVGGWAGAVIGAKMGAESGVVLGLELGPGAIITGAIGGILGGAIGFYAEDWVMDEAGL
jgi:hypothetical protein